jgi:hypothetical protein
MIRVTKSIRGYFAISAVLGILKHRLESFLLESFLQAKHLYGMISERFRVLQGADVADSFVYMQTPRARVRSFDPKY